VGRPEKMRQRPWGAYGEEGDSTRYPTVAYEWDVVKLYTGTSGASYKSYTNEIDALTPAQVYEIAHISLWRHFHRKLTNVYVIGKLVAVSEPRVGLRAERDVRCGPCSLAVHGAHAVCVRRRVALATPRGQAVWEIPAYATGPAERYRWPRAPLVSALFFLAMISLR
jgi:hypothetical protein